MALIRRPGLIYPRQQNPLIIPQGAIEIDPDHPLSRGLVGAFPLNGTPADLTGKNTGAAVGGTGTWAGTARGVALNATSAGGYVSVSNASAIGAVCNGGPFTLSAWVNPVNFTNAAVFMSKDGASLTDSAATSDTLTPTGRAAASLTDTAAT